jgi:mannose-1-phosphate guanylyltransferase
VQAIVLVGGEGTRLRPLTSDVPKPAVTLVDRPFLAYAIEWLAAHGVTEVVLACGFLPGVLREALRDEEQRAGVRITYVAEPEPLGTAGAIRFAADSLGDRLEDRFLALNGDVLADLDLSALLRAHEEHGASATIGLQINAGAYVLQRPVLDLIPPGQAVSIEREVFPRLIGEGLCGLLLDGYWMDIGTPERYLQASWDILEGTVETRVKPTAPGLLVGEGAEIDAEAGVGPRAVVAPGCRVERGATVADSVLLDGCVVGRDALVRDSILAPGATVEPGAQLVDAVVGRDERVPA